MAPPMPGRAFLESKDVHVHVCLYRAVSFRKIHMKAKKLNVIRFSVSTARRYPKGNGQTIMRVEDPIVNPRRVHRFTIAPINHCCLFCETSANLGCTGTDFQSSHTVFLQFKRSRCCQRRYALFVQNPKTHRTGQSHTIRLYILLPLGILLSSIGYLKRSGMGRTIPPD